MERKSFQVEVVCSQRLLYLVDAEDPAGAERIAMERWQGRQASDLTGFDRCQIEAIHAERTPAAESQAQDDELLLRFIREREGLLTRLGGNLLAASANDAVSAFQAAADLGWVRDAQDGSSAADGVRAAHALERLCASKKLVCFERERARSGERGAIRLYCTPEYLERLSATVYDTPSPASI